MPLWIWSVSDNMPLISSTDLDFIVSPPTSLHYIIQKMEQINMEGNLFVGCVTWKTT